MKKTIDEFTTKIHCTWIQPGIDSDKPRLMRLIRDEDDGTKTEIILTHADIIHMEKFFSSSRVFKLL